MALKHVKRSRVPLDGRWFRTTASLQSILRDAARYDDEMSWPACVGETWVPVWVSMRQCNDAQKTRANPEGLIYRPTVRIGEFCSPEVQVSYGYSAGLTIDSNLDGWEAQDHHQWLYRVYEGDAPLGADASGYICDKCGEMVYRDDLGVRDSRSATIQDGTLICRDCEFLGLITPQATVERLERVRKLADYVGGECRKHFERQIEVIARKESWGKPAQTRLLLDGHGWSFFWSERVLVDGSWKRGMIGGLIQHGPTPHLGDDGAFTFTTWDYGKECQRAATVDEIRGIRWGIHT